MNAVFVDTSYFLALELANDKNHHKEYSLTDCISFVTMRGADMSVAFAFDHHFAQAGFRKNP